MFLNALKVGEAWRRLEEVDVVGLKRTSSSCAMSLIEACQSGDAARVQRLLEERQIDKAAYLFILFTLSRTFSHFLGLHLTFSTFL